MTTSPTSQEWGRRAALIIQQMRMETGSGPTFPELFRGLLPQTEGLPGPLPAEYTYRDRRYAINRFRYGCALVWADLGWIRWRRGTERSLDIGPTVTIRPSSAG